MSATPCPCGSGKSFVDCCEDYLEGNDKPPTAEALMRSRYSAYALRHLVYLDDTYHPDMQAKMNSTALEEAALQVKWLGLEIVSTEKGGETDNEGFVDFIAHYEENGRRHAMREKSRFVKESGMWYYVEGVVNNLPLKNSAKVGRNEPCPCGSGKKYKRCCG